MKGKTLPPTFHFSQSSLQDYVDCPRRFELRYVLRQAWPAVQAQPIQNAERQMWLGSAFHRLAHQFTVGIPVENITQGIDDDDLRRWWQAFLNAPPQGLPTAVRLAEVSLFTVVAGYRLMAKYDLIAADDGRIVVVDWKTNQNRPPSAWLTRRLQTRVYPYIAAEVGKSVISRHAERSEASQLSPGQVSMVYWFAEYPHQTTWFHYSQARHRENHDFLSGLIAEISARRPGDFPLTDDERRCRFCVYRSLCEKDLPPGEIAEGEETETSTDVQDWEGDLEQVAEIAY